MDYKSELSPVREFIVTCQKHDHADLNQDGFISMMGKLADCNERLDRAKKASRNDATVSKQVSKMDDAMDDYRWYMLYLFLEME